MSKYETTCVICGKTILDSHKGRLYCSRACESLAKKGKSVGPYSKERVAAVQAAKLASRIEKNSELFKQLDEDQDFQLTMKLNYLDHVEQYRKLYGFSLSQLRTYFKLKGYTLTTIDYPENFTKVKGASFQWFCEIVKSSSNYTEFRAKFLASYENMGFTKRTLNRSLLLKFCSLRCEADSERFLYDKGTLPEIIVRETLDKLDVKFETQKILKRNEFFYDKNDTLRQRNWRPDFFLPELNTAIEVNGDYWHSWGISYEKMNDMQKTRFLEDEKKYLFYKEQGIKCIIIWEHDVKNGKTTEILQEKLNEVKGRKEE